MSKGDAVPPTRRDLLRGSADWVAAVKDLKLRCDPNDRFLPLRELFPHPMVPFHRAPRRPNITAARAVDRELTLSFYIFVEILNFKVGFRVRE